MSKPWSKLQKEYYLIKADGINLQLQCRAYRMNTQSGNTNCPRYWISLDKEIIWDYPKDFRASIDSKISDIKFYPYINDTGSISNLIREYIDTPKDEILSKSFENDHWDLIDILRASDKRIGIRRLKELKEAANNPAVHKIIEARFAKS